MNLPDTASDAGPNQKEDALATQEEAALVAAFAERALEDGVLIEGARLTKAEFLAMTNVEEKLPC